MKVLMFGWEFPPFKSGGLGTACHDLCKGLARQGVEVTFVMPVAPENAQADFVKLIGANNVAKLKLKTIPSLLKPYQNAFSYAAEYVRFASANTSSVYGQNLYEEVHRYSLVAEHIAKEEKHDVIHAHDWMTYQAGIRAKKVSGKPLVVHIHATEFDRTGGNPNTFISHLEYTGLKEADLVIANSNWTKNNVIKAYKIPAEKIKVVHWGIEEENPWYHLNYQSPLKQKYKIVLFLGRVTIQKGPDYFVEAAKKVLDHEKNVKFLVVGDGDMLPFCIRRAAELGIQDKMIFAGAMRGADVHKAFQTADVFVMPSISEPFGLVALEALKNKTPIIISKQSGVAEVVNHCLKVDFWDVDELASKIISVLRYRPLWQELKQNGHREVQKFNLDEPARKTIAVYQEALALAKV